MQDRDWSALHQSRWQNVNPREYVKWVGGSRRLNEMLNYVKYMDGEDKQMDEDDDFAAVLQTVLEENKQIHANVRSFQKDMNKKFNETLFCRSY